MAVDRILAHDSWRLFLEGWGAAAYARMIAHPQPGKVQSSDLLQLVYFGTASHRVLASEDLEYRNLANSLLDGRYRLARVVPLDAMLG